MALAINGILGVKSVNKKVEQTNYGSKTIYYGIASTSLEFSRETIDMPFKMETTNEKQVMNLEKWFMIAGKSFFARGVLGKNANGEAALILDKVEFGTMKMEGNNYNQGNNNGGYQQRQNNNSNGYQQRQNNNGGYQSGNNNGGYQSNNNNGGYGGAQENKQIIDNFQNGADSNEEEAGNSPWSTFVPQNKNNG